MKTIYLAGGCFWGVEHFFSLVPGVVKTTTGYANGDAMNPTYEMVCSKKYKFAETVKVDFDESVITLDRLLDKFFMIIDVTSLNKQGGDVGLQYRTGIYYTEEADRAFAEKKMAELQRSHSKPIAIELVELKNFYNAEDYHQDYLNKNPNGYCHIPLAMFEKAAL
ncbi:MAG: peptide-methionine (S)-S-oxide reductase MsrA [Sphaerochaeta sp.]